METSNGIMEGAAKLKKQIHVTGAVFLRAGKVLAAQRGAGRNLAGFWEFPGGKIEAGRAARRRLPVNYAKNCLPKH
ncbi:NUDIX domain-containing protein [Arcanobacterium hippocoleae]